MTRVEVWNFIALLGAVSATAYAVFYQIPMLARTTYQHRLSSLRDRVVDATLDGRLPADADCVEAFIRRCEAMREDARGLTLLRAAFLTHAVSRSNLDIDAYARRLRPSYNGLTAAERSLMHNFGREYDAVSLTYLLNGSPTGWLLKGFIGLVRTTAARLANAQRETQTLHDKLESKTETLAKEYSETVVSRADDLGRRRRKKALAHI